MNELPTFWRKFCLFTSPTFWLVTIVVALFGAVYGIIHFTRYLFRS